MLNDRLRLFATHNKKVQTYRKDKGKKHKDDHDSNSQKTMHEMLFLCFRFFRVKWVLSEFDINGRIGWVLTNKHKPISKVNKTFGIGNNIPKCNTNSDEKLC